LGVEKNEKKTPYKLNKDNNKTLRRGSNNDSAIAGSIGQKLLTIYTFYISTFLYFYVLYCIF
jgi:hypothetical protein